MKRIARTEVRHKDVTFIVVTHERETLPDGTPCRHTETTAFEYDQFHETVGKSVGGCIGPHDSLFSHIRMVRRLFETGRTD